MKALNILFIVLFLLGLVVPAALFNAAPDQVSAIDNTTLPEAPAFTWSALAEGEFMPEFKTYFQKRLGLRTEAITFYQQLHDKVYGILIHPIYTYGRDKEVFFEFGYEMEDYPYLDLYADFVAQMRRYCVERGIAFYYALTPPKTQLYAEYLAEGVHYRYRQYDYLLEAMAGRGVEVLDLMEPLTRAKAGGRVYDRQNDPAHWNGYGAFSGISWLLERMGQDFPALHALDAEDFDITPVEITTLPVSYFPIRETTVSYTPKAQQAGQITGELDDMRVSPIFPEYTLYRNPDNPEGPRALVFHGSHFATAPKYMVDQFSEILFVYSYGTIFDLPYYAELFHPDLVLYEVATQIISDSDYYKRELLQTVQLPPVAANGVDSPG